MRRNRLGVKALLSLCLLAVIAAVAGSASSSTIVAAAQVYPARAGASHVHQDRGARSAGRHRPAPRRASSAAAGKKASWCGASIYCRLAVSGVQSFLHAKGQARRTGRHVYRSRPDRPAGLVAGSRVRQRPGAVKRSRPDRPAGLVAGSRASQRARLQAPSTARQPALNGMAHPFAAQNSNGTYNETVGGTANTWTNYTNAGGYEGPQIPAYDTVQIACALQGFRVADGNTWWYQIASSPWNYSYYVSADAFYNNGADVGQP